MDYREFLKANRQLLAIPLQVSGKKVSLESLVNRLSAERDLFTGGVLQLPPEQAAALLVVVVDRPCWRSLELTLKTWSLQSCPLVRATVVPSRAADPQESRLKVDRLRAQLGLDVRVDSHLLHESSSGNEFIVLARAGDLFHPSLVATLALTSAREPADVVVWNDGRYRATKRSLEACELVRRPELERHTLRHVSYVGNAFAVRPELLSSYPYALIDHFLDADSHPLHLWLAERAGVRWCTHPEYLSFRPAERPERPAAFPSLMSVYRGILASLASEFSLVEDGRGPLPYRLVPRRSATKISVVISFRDKVRETTRCLRSVLRQQVSGTLELVLVDNRSASENRTRIEALLKQQSAGREIRIIDYPSPFNHSQQCMRGVEASSGDVVVFLNNDAELVDQDVLEEMAAWALVPGISTVGCRVTKPDGTLVCAGIEAVRGDSGNQVVVYRECEKAAFSTVVRETLGNTFACAAVSRETLKRVGPLDAVQFPNGYNDVEFCLRAARAGYRHIYLGHLRVNHVPATSRGRSDELRQLLLLQTQHLDQGRRCLFSLDRPVLVGSESEGKSLGANLGRPRRRVERVVTAIRSSRLAHQLRSRPVLLAASRATLRALRRLLGGRPTGWPEGQRTVMGVPLRVEVVTSCPGCGGVKTSLWRTARDTAFRVVEGEFPYVRCRSCGLIYLLVRPRESEALTLYPEDYPPYLGGKPRSPVNPTPLDLSPGRLNNGLIREIHARLGNLLDRIAPNQLRETLRNFYEPPDLGATLLDFGCGSTAFLDKARDQGWVTIGMDASEEVIEGVRRHGHSGLLAPAGLEEIKDHSLDVIRLNHVIEHLYHPKDVLAGVRRKLKLNGGLHLATPNPLGLSSLLFRSYWWGLEAPRHVMLYTPPLLKAWLEELGFTAVTVVPERAGKDFMRSLAILMHALGRIEHDAIGRMAEDPVTNGWASVVTRVAALVGRADRYHIFARST